jgi:hypothetical protein
LVIRLYPGFGLRKPRFVGFFFSPSLDGCLLLLWLSFAS